MNSVLVGDQLLHLVGSLSCFIAVLGWVSDVQLPNPQVKKVHSWEAWPSVE